MCTDGKIEGKIGESASLWRKSFSRPVLSDAVGTSHCGAWVLCNYPKLRCTVSIKYAPDFEASVQRKII